MGESTQEVAAESAVPNHADLVDEPANESCRVGWRMYAVVGTFYASSRERTGHSDGLGPQTAPWRILRGCQKTVLICPKVRYHSAALSATVGCGMWLTPQPQVAESIFHSDKMDENFKLVLRDLEVFGREGRMGFLSLQ